MTKEVTNINGYKYIRQGDLFLATCNKCAGSGLYDNRAGYHCFKCGGSGTVGQPMDESSAYKRADKLAHEQAIRDSIRHALEDRRREENLARAQEREAKRAEKQLEWEAKVAPTEHVGTVGQELTVDGRITSIREVESVYGTSRLIVVRSSESVIVKTFSSAHWAWDANEGDDIRLTGTVKEHSDWHGERTTMLSKCKHQLIAPASVS